MIPIELNQLGYEDLLFGVGIVTQTRQGKEVQVSQINAFNIPFDENHVIADVIADKATLEQYKAMKEEVTQILNYFDTIINKPPQEWLDYIDNGVHPHRTDKPYPAGSIVTVGGIPFYTPQDIGAEAFSNKWKPVICNYTGMWIDTHTYVTGDIVSVEDVVYVAKQESTGEDPTTSLSNWDIVFLPDGIQRWREKKTYDKGDVCYSSDYVIYKSVIDINRGQNPEDPDQRAWELLKQEVKIQGIKIGDMKFKLINIARLEQEEPEWLIMNGAEVSRTAYTDLFAFAERNDLIIPQSEWEGDDANKCLFGEGDGSTTFCIPDYTLLAPHVRAYSPSKPITKFQKDQIRNIEGVFGLLYPDQSASNSGAFVNKGGSDYNGYTNGRDGRWQTFGFDASQVVPTGTENQPYGVCLIPLIRY